LVGSVEYGVESFEETLAVDEVKSRAAWAANVGNNQVNCAGSTTDNRVEVTRPYLSIGSQIERIATNNEGQGLQIRELSGSDSEQTSVVVENTTGGRLVTVKGIGGNKNEGSASVNNTGSGGKNSGGAILNGLVNTPV